MTITESRPNELVRIKLEFIKPFAATNTAEFTLKPERDRTAVTWSMYGHNNFIGKAVCLVMNMDKTLGGEFDKGLAAMKPVAEAAARELEGGVAMRCMVLVKASKDSEAESCRARSCSPRWASTTRSW